MAAQGERKETGRACGGNWASELTDLPKEITFRGDRNKLLTYLLCFGLEAGGRFWGKGEGANNSSVL